MKVDIKRLEMLEETLSHLELEKEQKLTEVRHIRKSIRTIKREITDNEQIAKN